MEVSVIIPVFNEKENLQALWEETCAALQPEQTDFELLFVDDGSTDGSTDRLRALNAGPRLRVISHLRNFGQSSAIATGFRHARGQVIVTLDGDGQNDPSDIPQLLEKLRTGRADCITGVRTVRNDSRLKRVSSRLANAFRNWITGDQTADSGCGIRAARRDALLSLPEFNGLHRFIPTLLRARGFRVEEMPVRHRPRRSGVTKYGVHNRLWRGIRDCFAMRWYLRRSFPAHRTTGETELQHGC